MSAIALSAVLAAAAIVDQVSLHSLGDHAGAMYAPYGKDAVDGLLYGLVYTVAGLQVLLWSAVLRPVRARSRIAPVVTFTVVAVTASLALMLLVTTEYGTQIFPPLWGSLAALSPAAGIVAAVLMLRR